ncbi:MAG: flavin oxidoreductase [Chitinophagaceae bacterium]|nr:flavin oxidoreductase [Chitinophagaceae bacterium]
MQHFNHTDFNQWSRIYRANFINSLSGFKSVSLIGTSNKQGQPNLAIFSNIIHLGADPALIGFINRPLEAAPHTIANIESTGTYTINHIQESFYKKAHQTSAKYPSEISEFDTTGLTPLWRPSISSPFVGESVIQYALQLVEIIPIKLNRTFLVIGTITDAFVSKEWIEDDGFIDLEKAKSITSLGIDGYYNVQKIDRLPYAKP